MTPQMFDLTDNVAVVTGAARGMGQAMAMALAEAGSNLMLVDRNESGARETAAAITAHAGMPGRDGFLSNVALQKIVGPQFIRVAEILGLLTGEVSHPSHCLVGNPPGLTGSR